MLSYYLYPPPHPKKNTFPFFLLLYVFSTVLC